MPHAFQERRRVALYRRNSATLSRYRYICTKTPLDHIAFFVQHYMLTISRYRYMMYSQPNKSNRRKPVNGRRIKSQTSYSASRKHEADHKNTISRYRDMKRKGKENHGS